MKYLLNEHAVLVFSAIAPIILLIGSFSFALLWMAHRYACLYINKPESDNGGRLYPAALFQLFTGLYVLQLCLIGLFALGQNGQGTSGSLSRVIMMGFSLVCTALYHRKLMEVYTPLFSRAIMNDVGDDGAGFPDNEKIVDISRKHSTSSSSSSSSSTSQDQVRQPVLDETRPVVWIPNDTNGVSSEEVRETKKIYGTTIPITNQNATLNSNGKVVCQSIEPPTQNSLTPIVKH
jgi:hypothetical protein